MILSDTQKQVVNYTGHLIVNAPPGSGKTFTLIKKIEKVQKESKKRILALTFSNKAAEELKNRIVDMKNVQTNTIHAFCQELISSRGFQINLPNNLRIIDKETDKLFILKEVINNSQYLTQNVKDTSQANLSNIAKFISNQKLKFIDPSFYKDKDENNFKLYYEIYNEYMNNMLSQNLIDFDDLLYYAYQILSLEETKTLYGRLYGHVYVDEAQDLNSSQYEIIKLLISLVDDSMLIGDPNQSIYLFMGANQNIMTQKYKIDFAAMTITLNENFRSAKSIVNLINKLRGENESLSKYPIEGKVEFNIYEDEEIEAQKIVEKIEVLLTEIKPEEIAILGRNIYLHNNIKKLLEQKNIEYNYGVSTKVSFETKEAKIFYNLIKLIDNPYNQILINDFNELFKTDFTNANDIINVISENYLSIYNEVNSISSNINLFSRGIDNLIADFSSIYKDDEHYRYLVISDFKFIRDNWFNYAKNNNIKTVTSFINDMVLGKTQTSNTEGISLLTIHKAKGLEFDTVFVIGLNEGTLPDYRSTIDNIEEEDNNVYVAFSRSKRRCYISAVKYKMMPWGSKRKQEISRYIKIVKDALTIGQDI